MAQKVGTVLIDMAADLANLQADFKDATKEARKFQRQQVNSYTKMATTIKATVGTLIGVGLFVETARGVKNFTQSILDNADELSKASRIYGVSIETLSRLQVVASFTGTEFQNLSKGFRTGQKALVQFARDGTGTGIKAFQDLGISIGEARELIKDSEASFFSIVKRIKGVEDSTRRLTIANEIFGRSAEDILKLVDGTAEDFQNLQKIADNLGLTLGSDLGKAAEEINDNFNQIALVFKGIGTQAVTQLLPGLQQISREFLKIAGNRKQLEELSIGVSSFISGIISGVSFLARAAIEVREVFISIEYYYTEAVNAVKRATNSLTGTDFEIIDTSDLEKQMAGLKTLVQAIRDGTETLTTNTIVIEKNGEKREELNETIEKQISNTYELIEAIKKQNQELKETNTFTSGAQEAWNNYRITVEDVASQSKKLFTDAFKGAEDALVEFSTTGKLSFKGMIDSLIADIARLAIRQAIIKPLMDSFSGGAFGTGNPFAGLFANGGNIPSGKFGIVGEAGPELVSGPASVTSAKDTAGMMAPSVTVNNYTDGQVSVKRSEKDYSMIIEITKKSLMGDREFVSGVRSIASS